MDLREAQQNVTNILAQFQYLSYRMVRRADYLKPKFSKGAKEDDFDLYTEEFISFAKAVIENILIFIELVHKLQNYNGTKVQIQQDSTNVPAQEDSAIVQLQEDNTNVPTQEDSTNAQAQEQGTDVPAQEYSTIVQVQEDNTIVQAQEQGTDVPAQEDSTIVQVQEDNTNVQTQENSTNVPAEKDSTDVQVQEDITDVQAQENINPNAEQSNRSDLNENTLSATEAMPNVNTEQEAAAPTSIKLSSRNRLSLKRWHTDTSKGSDKSKTSTHLFTDKNLSDPIAMLPQLNKNDLIEKYLSSCTGSFDEINEEEIDKCNQSVVSKADSEETVIISTMDNFTLCEKTGMFIADTSNDREHVSLNPAATEQGNLSDCNAMQWDNYDQEDTSSEALTEANLIKIEERSSGEPEADLPETNNFCENTQVQQDSDETVANATVAVKKEPVENVDIKTELPADDGGSTASGLDNSHNEDNDSDNLDEELRLRIHDDLFFIESNSGSSFGSEIESVEEQVIPGTVVTNPHIDKQGKSRDQQETTVLKGKGNDMDESTLNNIKELCYLHGITDCSVVVTRNQVAEQMVKERQLTKNVDRLTDLSDLKRASSKRHRHHKKHKKESNRKSSAFALYDSHEVVYDSDSSGSECNINVRYGYSDVALEREHVDADDLCLEKIRAMSENSTSDISSSESVQNEEKQKKKTKSDSDKKNVETTAQNTGECEIIEEKEKQGKSKPRAAWRSDPLLTGRLIVDSSSSYEDSDIEGDNVLPRQKLDECRDRMLDMQKEKITRKKRSRVGEESSDSSTGKEQQPRKKKSRARSSNSRSSVGSSIEFVSEKMAKTDGIVISSDDEVVNVSQSRGRRNIRAIQSDDTLRFETQMAKQLEDERQVRLSQRHKEMDTVLSQQSTESSKEGLVLDVDIVTKKPLVVVHPIITNRLKKHQQEGVRFMWDSCYESLSQLKKGPGSGCILAHCMGLGKTFQVITLIHTLFTHLATRTKLVLVVCPLSIVLNWNDEFDKCLSMVKTPSGNPFKVFCITERYKSRAERLYVVNRWLNEKGVLVVGYESYNSLVKFNLTKAPSELGKAEENIKKLLIDPGPDLVIVDEGHLLKKDKSLRTQCLSQIATRRRIVLTGTPLQNNLEEYYHMVQFVKPNLLGSHSEFMNRFGNPIKNGQYHDSTETDILAMKKRSHVLHSILKSTVQRFEMSVLLEYLPKMLDYALFINLHPLQADLYKLYIQKIKDSEFSLKKFFHHYTQLQFIWSHPYLLELKSLRKKSANKVVEIDTINLDPEEGELENQNPEPETQAEEKWWYPLDPLDMRDVLNYGTKFLVMFAILQECERIGDKVLVFCSSLLAMDAVEHFIKRQDTLKGKKWEPKRDYLRMDGSVSPDSRVKLCNIFNNPANKEMKMFLISHKVGGLGLNLVAANRVILMDTSWNPAYDNQSIFRVYRFGQTKPCYVYRLVCMGTMEEVVYERAVTKTAVSNRVVDKMQVSRHYTSHDLAFQYRCSLPGPDAIQIIQTVPQDKCLASVLHTHIREIIKYHEHRALLENQAHEVLNEDEMKLAWEEFRNENEKRDRAIQLQQQNALAQKANGQVNGPEPVVISINPMLSNMFENRINVGSGTDANGIGLPYHPDNILPHDNNRSAQSIRTYSAANTANEVHPTTSARPHPRPLLPLNPNKPSEDTANLSKKPMGFNSKSILTPPSSTSNSPGSAQPVPIELRPAFVSRRDGHLYGVSSAPGKSNGIMQTNFENNNWATVTNIDPNTRTNEYNPSYSIGDVTVSLLPPDGNENSTPDAAPILVPDDMDHLDFGGSVLPEQKYAASNPLQNNSAGKPLDIDQISMLTNLHNGMDVTISSIVKPKPSKDVIEID